MAASSSVYGFGCYRRCACDCAPFLGASARRYSRSLRRRSKPAFPSVPVHALASSSNDRRLFTASLATVANDAGHGPPTPDSIRPVAKAVDYFARLVVRGLRLSRLDATVSLCTSRSSISISGGGAAIEDRWRGRVRGGETSDERVSQIGTQAHGSRGTKVRWNSASSSLLSKKRPNTGTVNGLIKRRLRADAGVRSWSLGSS